MALRLWSVGLLRQLTAHVESRDFDVIQVEGLEMAPYLFALRALYGDGARRPRFILD